MEEVEGEVGGEVVVTDWADSTGGGRGGVTG